MVKNITKSIKVLYVISIYKFIMFFELFFCNFRAFNFSRCVNRVNNHVLFTFSTREIFVRVSDSFFHNMTPENKNYNISRKILAYSSFLKIDKSINGVAVW